MGNNGLGYMADEEDLPFEFKALELAIELTISSLDFQVSHTTMCQPGGGRRGGREPVFWSAGRADLAVHGARAHAV